MQDPVFLYEMKICQNYWVSQLKQLRSRSLRTGAKVRYFGHCERSRSVW
ncbi:hypothetical protein [Nostoc sp.]